jgi:hypothetical protein
MKKSFILKAFLFLLIIAGSMSLYAREVFVKPNASGTGASWNDAANISYIVGSSCADGDIIYIAAGDYLRTTQITISKYITLMGGYSSASTGTDLTQRDIANNKTLFKPDTGGLSRAININITTASGGSKVILDGLHFEGFSGSSQGAAVIITTAQGNIDLINLSFKNNTVTNSLGGALAMPTAVAFDITITMDGCYFEGNQAVFSSSNGYGGAFYFNNTTVPKTIYIKNSTFKNNYAYGRGACGYLGTNMQVNISDCLFDSNQCTTTLDNTSNGGCFYIVGTAGYGSTFNISKSIFLNGYITGKGSVIWFNNTTGSLVNNLNVSNSSLIGNYSSRTTSGRAAIDVDNYSTQLQFSLTNCVLSNYNNIGAVKSSRYADVMFVSLANSSNSCTFSNSILNGTYFSTGNVVSSITPPDTLYNKQRGFLADSTIALALSGDLKITDKIVFKKTFTPSNVGTWIHAQIFDVKTKMNIPMTLLATIPVGYKLRVDGKEYPAGEAVIEIAASASIPQIELTPLSAVNSPDMQLAKISHENGRVSVSIIEPGSRIAVFNQSGQLILQDIITTDTYQFDTKGFVMVRISDKTNSRIFKLIVQ